jgi:microcystin-dependent protein
MSVAGTVGYNGFPVPIGSIIPFITEESFPLEADGWLLCGGQTLAIEDFPDLYDVIGDAYAPAPSAEGLFTLPDLLVGGESFITGSSFTDGTRQTSSATFTRTSGPTTLGINNIPTLTQSSAVLNGTFTNTSGNVIKYTFNGSEELAPPTVPSISYGKSFGIVNPANTTTFNSSTIYYTNPTSNPIPVSQYTITGATHSEFVSVCYFIKAIYFSPPIIPPFTQTIPPTSGIYNETDSLSGFLGPFPTYSTGF